MPFQITTCSYTFKYPTLELNNLTRWRLGHSCTPMNQALYVGLTIPTQNIFLGFCLQVLCQTGPVQRVYWLVPMGKNGNMCKVLPVRRITKDTSTHCQFKNQTRSQQPFNRQPDAIPTKLSPPHLRT